MDAKINTKYVFMLSCVPRMIWMQSVLCGCDVKGLGFKGKLSFEGAMRRWVR